MWGQHYQMRAELYLGDANRANLDGLAALDNVDWGIADGPCPEVLQQVSSLEPAKLHVCTAHTHRHWPSALCVMRMTDLGVMARALQRFCQADTDRQSVVESHLCLLCSLTELEKLQQVKLPLTRRKYKMQIRFTSKAKCSTQSSSLAACNGRLANQF